MYFLRTVASSYIWFFMYKNTVSSATVITYVNIYGKLHVNGDKRVHQFVNYLKESYRKISGRWSMHEHLISISHKQEYVFVKSRKTPFWQLKETQAWDTCSLLII